MSWEVVVAFLSGGLAGVIAAWLGLRQLHSTNVISERQKWRDKLRESACEMATGSVRDNLWVDLQVRLNPFVPSEQKIVTTIRDYRGQVLPDTECEEAVREIAELLKHDWERAKRETSIFPFFASQRARRHIAKLKQPVTPNLVQGPASSGAASEEKPKPGSRPG